MIQKENHHAFQVVAKGLILTSGQIHYWNGRLLNLLGIVNCYLGLCKMKAPMAFWILLSGWIAVVLIVFIIAEIKVYPLMRIPRNMVEMLEMTGSKDAIRDYALQNCNNQCEQQALISGLTSLLFTVGSLIAVIMILGFIGIEKQWWFVQHLGVVPCL